MSFLSSVLNVSTIKAFTSVVWACRYQQGCPPRSGVLADLFSRSHTLRGFQNSPNQGHSLLPWALTSVH